MRTTVLFDLDGTLLPMDQELFIQAYFDGLCQKAAPHGYEPGKLVDTIWAGMAAMVKNDGSRTNEEAFWQLFSKVYGTAALKDSELFDAFYAHEFAEVQKVCGYNPKAPALIRWLQQNHVPIALATNPIFPAVATEQRIRWAGLDPYDFLLCTTYENSRHSKPNLDYYRAVLASLGVRPAQCIMVGNDVGEDMVAAELGMEVFLLTDCLINKPGTDITQYPHGDMDALRAFLKTQLQLSS